MFPSLQYLYEYAGEDISASFGVMEVEGGTGAFQIVGTVKGKSEEDRPFVLEEYFVSSLCCPARGVAVITLLWINRKLLL